MKSNYIYRNFSSKLALQSADERRSLQLYPCSHQEPLTFEDLLNRLPQQTVTASGRVVNVRKELRKRFSAKQHDTPVIQCTNNTLVVKDEPGALLPIRVYSEDGSQVYSLKMTTTNTVDELRLCIDQVRQDNPAGPYRLAMRTIQTASDAPSNSAVGSMCFHCLPEGEVTLREAGITGPTVLIMKPLPRATANRNQTSSSTLMRAIGREWHPTTSFSKESEKD